MVNIPVVWRAGQAANTELSGIQNDSSIIQLANGNFLVAYVSDSTVGIAGTQPGKDILGQMFDPMGNRIGAELLLSRPGSVVDERNPQLAALPDGGFMLVYENHFYNDPSHPTRDNDIYVRRFDANGVLVPNSERYLAIDTIPGDATYYGTPNITVSSATSVLITYYRFDLNGVIFLSESDVFGRIYNPATNTYGNEFKIFDGGTTQGGNEYDIDVLSNGNYVVVADTNTGGDLGFTGTTPSIIILSPTGQRLFSKLLPNENEDQRINYSVSATDDGGFLLTWEKLTSFNQSQLQFVKFNSAGTQQFFGTMQDAGNLKDPVVASLRDGSFVIVFDDNTNDSLAIRHFAANGADLGRYDFVITSNGAHDPQVIDLMDGRFAVTWSSGGQNVGFQIFDTRNGANSTAVYTPNQWQIGTIFDDNIIVDPSVEYVYGYGGNDVFSEAGEGKYYFGGDGNDTFYAMTAIGSDRRDGGAGNDTANFMFSPEQEGVWFDLTNGKAYVGTRIEILSSIENLIGTRNDDVIFGENGANRLSGVAGNDEIYGQDGNDRITGGNGDDVLYGGLGNDVLNGGSGIDQLRGNEGADRFLFSADLQGGNADVIHDFDASIDFIQLDNNVFQAFTYTGRLAKGAFNTGTAASDANDRIIYDPATGVLRYDADGEGGVAAIKFATLSNKAALTFADFIIV